MKNGCKASGSRDLGGEEGKHDAHSSHWLVDRAGSCSPSTPCWPLTFAAHDPGHTITGAAFEYEGAPSSRPRLPRSDHNKRQGGVPYIPLSAHTGSTVLTGFARSPACSLFGSYSARTRSSHGSTTVLSIRASPTILCIDEPAGIRDRFPAPRRVGGPGAREPVPSNVASRSKRDRRSTPQRQPLW